MKIDPRANWDGLSENGARLPEEERRFQYSFSYGGKAFLS
jgi:hypothetical protein